VLRPLVPHVRHDHSLAVCIHHRPCPGRRQSLFSSPMTPPVISRILALECRSEPSVLSDVVNGSGRGRSNDHPCW
jgi:hypothetical protein